MMTQKQRKCVCVREKHVSCIVYRISYIVQYCHNVVSYTYRDYYFRRDTCIYLLNKTYRLYIVYSRVFGLCFPVIC